MHYSPEIINYSKKLVNSKEYRTLFAEQVVGVVAHIDMLDLNAPERIEVNEVYMYGYYWSYKVDNNTGWGMKEGRIHRNIYPQAYIDLNGNVRTSSWFYDTYKNRCRDGSIPKNDILAGNLHVNMIKTSISKNRQCPICRGVIMGKFGFKNVKFHKPGNRHTHSKQHIKFKTLYMDMLYNEFHKILNMDVLEKIVEYL